MMTSQSLPASVSLRPINGSSPFSAEIDAQPKAESWIAARTGEFARRHHPEPGRQWIGRDFHADKGIISMLQQYCFCASAVEASLPPMAQRRNWRAKILTAECDRDLVTRSGFAVAISSQHRRLRHEWLAQLAG